MHKIGYRIIRAASPEQLEERVVELIADGWRPVGSFVVMTANVDKFSACFQQMEKNDRSVMDCIDEMKRMLCIE